jgi:predicted DNA repair protein MutK
MAVANLLALIDDVASVLDDVALLTKAATQKTAGVLGDDLALNAQQVAGVAAERELPVVWSVAKGSLVNKAILVPAALAVSALAPWLVTALLMVGGAYLCFEGFEKLPHRFLGGDRGEAEHRRKLSEALADPSRDMVAIERDRIKGAVRTDFVLSAEIIVIALGIVAAAPFATRVAVLVGVAILMTVGVYGIVAGIVKIDDAGLRLCRHGGASRAIGNALVSSAPYLMKGLAFAGTAAMFLVGGGILAHGIAPLQRRVEAWAQRAGDIPYAGTALEALAPALGSLVVGIAAGGVVYVAVRLAGRLKPARGTPAE